MKALVVGAGPAGSSTAIALRQAGWSVHLIEQRPTWTGRVCGSFLSAEAVQHLESFLPKEFLLKEASTISTTALTLPSGFQTNFPTSQRNRNALAIPREKIESALLETATHLGTDITMGARLISYRKSTRGWNVEINEGGQVHVHETDLLFLADGRFSQAHNKPLERKGWYGFNATFQNIDQPPGEQSLHFFPGGYIGVTGYANGTTNVCGLIHRRRAEKISWETVVNESRQISPPFDRRLNGAKRISEWRGTGALPFGIYIKAEGPILAGDAAAVGDPFMGEGIGRALAAGPMIKLALQKSGTTDLSHLPKIYASLWNQTYRKRWQANSVLRFILKDKATFNILNLLLRFQPFLTQFGRISHTGFETPEQA